MPYRLSTLRTDVADYLASRRRYDAFQQIAYFAPCPSCGRLALWQSVRSYRYHETNPFCPCPPQRTTQAKESS